MELSGQSPGRLASRNPCLNREAATAAGQKGGGEQSDQEA